MLNYPELVKELQEKDEWAVDKLGLYFELTMIADTTGCSNEDFNEVVNYLHDIYMNNDETDFRYLGFATAAARICNYDLSTLLTSIRENSDELREQILAEYNAIC